MPSKIERRTLSLQDDISAARTAYFLPVSDPNHTVSRILRILDACEKMEGALMRISTERDVIRGNKYPSLGAEIARETLKEIRGFNESDLTCTLPNGSVIHLTGVDADEEEKNKLLGTPSPPPSPLPLMTALDLIEEVVTEENMETNPYAIKLARMLNLAIEQRNRWADWYIDTREMRLDQRTERNKDNAELDRIASE